jgi:choline dehydrogenase-like flavoprotein
MSTAALAALCDTFIPAIQQADDPDGYWARSASSQGIAEKIQALVASTKAEDRVRLEQLLALLSSPLLGLSWLGPLKSAERLSPAQRERLLHRWANSPIPELRNGFQVLRKLCCILYFGDAAAPPGGGPSENPNWKSIGYQPISDPARLDPAPLSLFDPGMAEQLHCDVLVVGSGAGGSIVAAELAAAGQDVLVADKGMYSPTHEFAQREFPTLQRHFEAGGLLSAHSGAIAVLAGSSFGGGTTINWAGALRTPDDVLEEWATGHGNPHFVQADYQKGFEAVEKRNNIGTGHRHNPQNAALLQAAQHLGLPVAPIPMNLRFPDDIPAEKAWQATGYSCYGDAYGIKQGAAQTFLHDAARHGTRLLPRAEALRILVEKGEAVGAEFAFAAVDGQMRHLRVRAKRVVLAAGALHTPVLLLKSGVQHPEIGRNLYLHPVAAVAGLHRSDTLPWQGPMMSVVVQAFAHLDQNWGVRIECPPLHPGLAAFALSWENGRQIKEDLLNLRRTAVHIVLTRDRFGGRVVVGKRSGQPVIHYDLHAYDRGHLLRGLEESARLHAASGVERLSVLHNRPLHFRPGDGPIEAFLPEIRRRNWGKNHFGLFSAHQMGTCRMGGQDKGYPVQPDGRLRALRNLYVADGSLFPSASGTNPMLSIQALAWWVAQEMKSLS